MWDIDRCVLASGMGVDTHLLPCDTDISQFKAALPPLRFRLAVPDGNPNLGGYRNSELSETTLRSRCPFVPAICSEAPTHIACSHSTKHARGRKRDQLNLIQAFQIKMYRVATGTADSSKGTLGVYLTQASRDPARDSIASCAWRSAERRASSINLTRTWHNQSSQPFLLDGVIRLQQIATAIQSLQNVAESEPRIVSFFGARTRWRLLTVCTRTPTQVLNRPTHPSVSDEPSRLAAQAGASRAL